MPKTLSAAGVVAATGVATLFASGLAVPAEAASAATATAVIRSCSKTVDGLTLRVKMRFDNGVMRVRVSHPDGKGNFRERHVRRTAAVLAFESRPVPPDSNGNEIGSAAWARGYGDQPVYRTRGWSATNTAVVTFKLVNGKRVTVSCTQRF